MVVMVLYRFLRKLKTDLLEQRAIKRYWVYRELICYMFVGDQLRAENNQRKYCFKKHKNSIVVIL